MASPFRYNYSSGNGFFHFSGSSGVIYFKYNFVNKGLPIQYSRVYQQAAGNQPPENQQAAKNQQEAEKLPAEEKAKAVE